MLPPYRIALLGDSATQHLATALTGHAYDRGLGLSLFDADYDQLDTQIMDDSSELYAFGADAVAIFLCVEKLYAAYCATAQTDRSQFADNIYMKITSYWQTLLRHAELPILQFNFAEADDGVFGNYANKLEFSFLYQVRKLNYLLMQDSAASKNVHIVDLNAVQQRYGRKTLTDEKLYYLAKMPLTMQILPTVAKQVVDILLALRGRSAKCVILDLDNTIWGGVVGDDGLSGIQIGELGMGHAFSALQAWLLELRRRGILLAVCSKNEETSAKEPFISHPEMLLRLSDIAVFVANWENKADNIRLIQQTLQIGFDSMVFLDDNPFERDLVKSLLPEVCVPDLPADPAQVLNYLQSLNLFETVSYSDADRDRTEQYQTESLRQAQMRQYASYDTYLISLEMCATAKPFDAFHIPRIAQLTQRSNQFNLRTVRYTEAEIAAMAENPRYITLYFTLQDKLSDYGLIGVVILEEQNAGTLFVNTWLMSCRVLKRGMEEFIINKVMETASRLHYRQVIGEYLPTAKNAMVANIYENMGFTAAGEGRYAAQTQTFTPRPTRIKEETNG